MYYFKKLNENYYIYIILIFVFTPINFIPQLFDGVIFDYAYETGNITGLELWYKEFSRRIHLLIIYLVYSCLYSSKVVVKIISPGFTNLC